MARLKALATNLVIPVVYLGFEWLDEVILCIATQTAYSLKKCYLLAKHQYITAF